MVPRSSSPAPAPASANDPCLFTLVQAGRLLEDRVEAALDTVGLSAAQFAILHQLVCAGRPLALSELACVAKCVRSNVTQLVDRLERDGLVQRGKDPEDRRSVLASLTPAGKKQEAKGARILQRAQAEFDTVISAADRAAIVRVLAALQ